DLGFRREGLAGFSLDPSLNSYKSDRIRQLAQTLQQRVSAIPGARSAAIGVNRVLAGDQDMSSLFVEGYQPKEDESVGAWRDSVSPGYFSTLGIPMLLGRDFTARDQAGAPRVAIVNE